MSNKEYIKGILWCNNNEINIHCDKFIKLKNIMNKKRIDINNHGDELFKSTIKNVLNNFKDIDYKVIANLENISVSIVEQEFELVKEFIAIFKNNNTPFECELINVPYSFDTIWSLITPLLSKEALKIVKIRKNESYMDSFFNMIGYD